MKITAPTDDAVWNSTGTHTVHWTSPEPGVPPMFDISLENLNVVPSQLLLLRDQALSNLTHYTFNSVLPIGQHYRIRLACVFPNNTAFVVESDQFNIISGGPTPEESVTVINGTSTSLVIATTTPAIESNNLPTTLTAFVSVTTLANSPSSIVTSTPFSLTSSSATSTALPDGVSTGGGIGIGIAVTIAVIIFIAAVGALMIWFWMRRSARRRRDEQTGTNTNQIGFWENQRPRQRESLFARDAMAIVEWRSQSRAATESPQLYLHSPLGLDSSGEEPIPTHEDSVRTG